MDNYLKQAVELKGFTILLPSDQSRIVSRNGKVRFTPFSGNVSGCQDLYICVVDVLPEVGDWYIVNLHDKSTGRMVPHLEQVKLIDDVWVNNDEHSTTRHIENCHKIAAATNTDLISKGVQQISDSFAEFFCEMDGAIDKVTLVMEDGVMSEIFFK